MLTEIPALVSVDLGARVLNAKLRAVCGWQLLNPSNSYHLVSPFPPTAVADVLTEGDTVAVGLLA